MSSMTILIRMLANHQDQTLGQYGGLSALGVSVDNVWVNIIALSPLNISCRI